jgi:hypothetical protein
MTRASGRWWRAHRSAAARGGGLAGAALDRAAAHQIVREWALRVAKAFAHVTEESRGRPCLVGSRHQKGAARLLRRGHTHDGEALEEKEMSGDDFSPRVE